MTTDFIAPDGKPRCQWTSVTPDFVPYHDNEWGFPVDDDIRLFEKVCLESFQSGLSWRTILNKRDNFRAAFDGFDFNKIATYDRKDIKRLLTDTGIVRHQGKIEAVINNAKCAQALVAEAGSLAAFFWRFEPTTPATEEPLTASTSPESIALAKQLKKMGWKFVGPTTCYAFMQAMGLINDHSHTCITRARVAAARQQFEKPT
ncbi:DNA-3-methyladenine glycosylase 1 [BD1-7 clade bacterium]|uniref:DNA-3-methyladenine glycosylase 1 n=1 Tax=BD1-7 clade bacterium TaxID=2029982 RepID=A0A5S9N5V4_9GAMM|nr:DNA-3-methyladenine glycosylase 1 [BD1-7 clade bacterium]